MKVAIYMRCSTDMQDMSTVDQRKKLKNYCSEKKYIIVKEFIDEGISGTTIENRPGVMRIFQMVQTRQHDFAKLIILNESRFGRLPNTKEAFHYEYLLEQAGVYIEYVESESNIPGAPGLIMRAVKYEQAAEFSKQLSRDVIRGHSTAARMGYSTGGFPPLGYKRMVCDEAGNPIQVLEPGQRKAVKNFWVKWVPGEKSAVETVNRMFNLYVHGGKGVKAICRILNKEKILSPKGGLWGTFSIFAILHNRAYIGERIYGGKWSKVVTEKVVCENAHEPIVPRELFDQAQKIMKKRMFGKSNGLRTDYLLSGKIVCKDCGYKFQGRRTKNPVGTEYTYYVDSGFQNYKVCKSLHIPRNSRGAVVGIEDFVIAQIQKMLDKDQYVKRFKDYLKEALIRLEKGAASTYPDIKKKLRELDKEIKSIQDILIETKSKTLAERLLQREDERSELLKELKKCDSIKNQPSKVLLLVNDYTRALRNISEVLQKRDAGEKKTAIGLFLDRIEVFREEGVARCYFYDLPKIRKDDYILPGYSPQCVRQVGAEGGI